MNTDDIVYWDADRNVVDKSSKGGNGRLYWDVGSEFGIGDGEVFELGVSEQVGYGNVRNFNKGVKSLKGGLIVGFGVIVGWGVYIGVPYEVDSW